MTVTSKDGRMLIWWDEVEKRPAPVFLTSASGFFTYIALTTGTRWLWVVVVVCGLYAIEITIWRAVRAALAALEATKNSE